MNEPIKAQGDLIELPEAKPKKSRGRRRNLEALLSSERPDWNSPADIIALVRRVAPIGLDPCSNPASIVGASTSWSLEKGDNGLIQPWGGHGLVYVNPPYGDDLPAWSAKLASESRIALGEFATEIIALLPSRTGTQHFKTCRRSCRALCFLEGRLTFLGAPDPAPFDSILFYWGPRPYRFADVAEPRGEIWIQDR